MQKGASFNLEAVKAQILKAIQARPSEPFHPQSQHTNKKDTP